MIFDLLSHQDLYRGVHPGFAAGFDWLKQFNHSMADCRVSIDGDRVIARVETYTTAPASEKRFETHRNYIDIQYMARGSEIMQYAAIGGLRIATPYDPATDFAFYADPPSFVPLRCSPGSFAIFFPHDGHKGACADGAPSEVRKVVIKVRV